jgi:hypothetical protein
VKHNSDEGTIKLLIMNVCKELQNLSKDGGGVGNKVFMFPHKCK